MRAVSLIVPAQLAKFAIGLAVQIVIARLLLPEGRGVYAISVATSTIILVLTHFGNEFGIRYLLISKRITSSQAFHYLVLTAVMSMIVSFGLIAAASLLEIWGSDSVTWQRISLACLFSISQLVTTQINVFLTLRGQYQEASILAVAEETLKLIATSIFLFSVPTVEIALFAAILANMFIASFSIVRYRFLPRDYEAIQIRDIRFIYKYGFESFWLNMSGLMTAHMGTLILSGLMSNSQIGLYNLAFGLVSRLQVLPDAMNRVLVPASMASLDQERRFNMIQISMTGLLAFSLIIAPLLGLLHEPIVILLFGREYAEAGTVAFILFLGFMFKLICKPLEAHFNEIVGVPKVIAAIQIFSIAAMALLTYIGAVTYGLNGAAVGSSVSIAMSSAALLVAYKLSMHRPISSLVAPRLLFDRIAKFLSRQAG